MSHLDSTSRPSTPAAGRPTTGTLGQPRAADRRPPRFLALAAGAFAVVVGCRLVGLDLAHLPGATAGLGWQSGDGRESGRQRVVLWGDSMAAEAAGPFTEALQANGADVLVRTFGGTAICDWLTDIDGQLRDWAPTTAVLAFSGNVLSSCMQGRDMVDAYSRDASVAADRLAAAGVDVVFAVAPPRWDQPVAADGTTDLEQIWRSVVATVLARLTARAPAGGATGEAPGRIEVFRAGLAVTDAGRWAERLPCRLGERCGPDGTVVVRGPDGTHFCPVAVPAMTACPVDSPGATRYGQALAQAAAAFRNDDATDEAGFEASEPAADSEN
ncbi:hypothetical protein [Frankia nepalensis]|uniref:Uncharacterized protein n=1 Tax=Frankia nepalensis TaxID=1836974 RepID=A0A937UR69_9ACTN|nr:hypothetical protein [Frankia nepalensis]MBL7496696.1 hypothetical protein [Frankia nepalensis]MBL7511074.1 hypothetical protein [Frankia nepalensis]MBL7627436.1 hypothetical protein [Frankia nepalensis]